MTKTEDLLARFVALTDSATMIVNTGGMDAYKGHIVGLNYHAPETADAAFDELRAIRDEAQALLAGTSH